MRRFAGKVAFITGAGRAQGRRHAVRLAEEGADIIAVDTTGAGAGALSETAGLVEMAGGRVVTAQADVRSMDALTAAVDKGVAGLGRLDIVLADVESIDAIPALEMSEQAWQDLIDLHLTGVWKTIKATVPQVVRGGRGGAVVVTSSLAAAPARGDGISRGTVKTGLMTLMKTLADELGPDGIRVNAVYHATTAADLMSGGAVSRPFAPDRGVTYGGSSAPVLTRMPVATLDPDDITNAVLFLVSDDGCYVSGTMHVVDVCRAS